MNFLVYKSIKTSVCFQFRNRNLTANLISKMSSSNLYKLSSNSNLLTNGRTNQFLQFLEYDCIGFDLDNTLCEYNVLPCLEMEYNALAEYLVKEKGYDPNYLLKPLDNCFLLKGLVADFHHGNLLKLGEDGVICRASHGTRFMTENEVKQVYGNRKTYNVTTEFCDSLVDAWNGPLSEKVRAFLDYFDMPAALAFARIIDSIDFKLGKPAEFYEVWPDVVAGLQNMYKREHFALNKGGYFKEIKSNPQKFIKKSDPTLIKWIKEMKESKILFLVTGSNYDFATLTAETSLGKDWQKLFDIVVFYARKPGFFTSDRPFLKLEGLTESDPIAPNDLSLGNMYSQGNWPELYNMFGNKLNKKEPKCLYFGDHLIQDVFTPSNYAKCDTVAVVEELFVEGVTGDGINKTSNAWGSYFYDENQCTDTFWNRIIRNNSQMCISSLPILAQYPINHGFKTFRSGPAEGYLPKSHVCHPKKL